MRFLALAAILALAASANAQPTAPAAPGPQDRITDRVALELGRLRIENATLAVTVDVLQAAVADLQAKLKSCTAEAPR